jgi:hypothetical protein
MLDQARSRCPRTTFVLSDVTREAPGIAPVDLATAFRFFGNAQDDLRRSALRAIHDLLGEGGYLILNNHRNPRSIHNLLLKARGEREAVDLNHSKLKGLLGDAGFRIVRTYGIGLWVVCSRLNQPHILTSRLARALEPISRFRPFGAYCPDAVILARRIS